MKKLFAIMLALALVVAFASASFAAAKPGNTVAIKGRMLLDVGYWFRSKEATASGDSVTTMFLNVPHWSYLRGVFTSADKTTGGRVEIGVGANEAGAKISARHVYGWWKVGNCTLLVGNTNPAFGNRAGAPRQVAGGIGDGGPGETSMETRGYGYSGRRPTIQLKWKSGAFAAELDLSSQQNRDNASDLAPAGATVEGYYYIPRVDINVSYTAGGFTVAPTFMVSNLSWDGAPSGADDDVVSWAVELPVVYKMGAFSVAAQVWYAQNNWGEVCCTDGAPVLDSNNKIQDGTQLGLFADLGYGMGKFDIHIGGGWLRTENDGWTNSNGYQNDSETRYGLYASLRYKVTSTFSVYPEIVYYNDGDDAATDYDNGDAWMVGLQFRFMF